jgi:hypothetical protein
MDFGKEQELLVKFWHFVAYLKGVISKKTACSLDLCGLPESL